MYVPTSREEENAFTAFDIFNKHRKGVVVRSRYGGVITLISLILMVVLLIYELVNFRSVELIQSVTVDTARDMSFNVYVDIVFHEMPCDDVHLDVVDVMGISQSTGPDVHKTPTLLNVPGQETCPPCHTSTKVKCCTCNELVAYFNLNSITESTDKYVQCKNLGGTAGCRVKGVMPLPKIQGNFHVAPGMLMQGGQGHSHQMNPFTFREDLAKMKLSHSILELKFGPDYPGMMNPLTDYHFFTHDLVKQTYYLRLVPTLYIEGSHVIPTHQYSVSNHTDVINLENSATLTLPGIFFKYDFSPMLVKLEKQYKYFTHLLVRLCAVIGGTWAVVGMVYSTGKTAVDKLKKKQ